MINPMLTISIVHFNTADLTKNCILSLLSVLDSTTLSDSFQISIVDNRSAVVEFEKLSEFLKSLNRSEIFFYRNCMNSGFGLGCMLTLNQSSGKYIAFVNSDTAYDEDCFTPLIEVLERSENIGIITPQHRDKNGVEINSYGYFESLRSRFLGNLFGRSRNGSQPVSASVTQKIDFPFGCFMLVRRDAFEKVGGFDPNVFLYYEEMDLCYRMLKFGYEAHFYPTASFMHIGGGSSGVEMSNTLRFESLVSMIYVVRKHRGVVYGFTFFILLVLQYFFKAFFKKRNREMFFKLLQSSYSLTMSHRLKQECNFDVSNHLFK